MPINEDQISKIFEEQILIYNFLVIPLELIKDILPFVIHCSNIVLDNPWSRSLTRLRSRRRLARSRGQNDTDIGIIGLRHPRIYLSTILRSMGTNSKLVLKRSVNPFLNMN